MNISIIFCRQIRPT